MGQENCWKQSVYAAAAAVAAAVAVAVAADVALEG